MPRVAALLAVGLSALAGCAAEAPDDDAIAGSAAGIPMGAIGASGVDVDGASARPAPPIVKGKPRPRGGRAAPPEALPDPFADPPAPELAPGPRPKSAPRAPRPTESKETTL